MIKLDKKSLKKVIFIVFLFFSLSISTASSYFYFANQKNANHGSSDQEIIIATRDENYLAQTPPEELKTLNILLVGYGGPGHQGGSLADAIQIVHFNFDKKKVALISIPRDLWVELPSGKKDKINQAFASDISSQKSSQISKAEITKNMANIVTGLPIDYFVSVDFVGLQRLVGEQLKGITVQVDETLDDPWYPIRGEELNPCGKTAEEIADLTRTLSGFELEKQFECRYEHLLFKPGLVKMEGGDVLKFTRSRHGSAGGDFSRSKRQQAVLKAMKAKIFDLEVYKNPKEFFENISYTIGTDLDLKIIEYLVPALYLAKDFEIVETTLSTENVFSSSKSASGQSILIPKSGINNWSETHNFIQSKI